jgi:hypothetical protein
VECEPLRDGIRTLVLMSSLKFGDFDRCSLSSEMWVARLRVLQRPAVREEERREREWRRDLCEGIGKTKMNMPGEGEAARNEEERVF